MLQTLYQLNMLLPQHACPVYIVGILYWGINTSDTDKEWAGTSANTSHASIGKIMIIANQMKATHRQCGSYGE